MSELLILYSTTDGHTRHICEQLEVFAGRIDYPHLHWADRTMIRLIMWMTRGPTDPDGVFELTDWGRVEAFGRKLAQGAGQI